MESSGGVSTFVENVTCLGCGCACDDIAVRTNHDGVDLVIVETRNVCAVAKSNGKFFYAAKEIKVTLGGCGG